MKSEDLGKVVQKATDEYDLLIDMIMMLLKAHYRERLTQREAYNIFTLCLVRTIDTIPKEYQKPTAEGIGKALVASFEEKK